MVNHLWCLENKSSTVRILYSNIICIWKYKDIDEERFDMYKVPLLGLDMLVRLLTSFM